MKKTRKFLSIFAILFVAIFAVGCVFMSACGKKDDDGEKDTTPQHTHNYVVTDSKEATCGKDGYITYKCEEDGDTYTEMVKATGEHTWDDGEVTTEPTCVDGEKTFTCVVCGATYTEAVTATDDHTFTEIDAEKDINWDWATDYSSATATVICDVCQNPVAFDATVTSESDDTGTTYTATVKINETDYTATKTVGPVVEPEGYGIPFSIDFNDPSTYSFIKFNGEIKDQTEVIVDTYTSGILTYKPLSGAKILDVSTSAGNVMTLTTKGKTTSSNGGYFELDLSSYVN